MKNYLGARIPKLPPEPVPTRTHGSEYNDTGLLIVAQRALIAELREENKGLVALLDHRHEVSRQ